VTRDNVEDTLLQSPNVRP